ncbi:MAG: methyltransferase domain-containing protein [Proteobacteria bacterium]|nr:methyltransferase domain-containing protein [Pseudomonadota bacterium]MCH8177676.1 methyltransferase domain-containing protein [Pseudomonadota bacterium]
MRNHPQKQIKNTNLTINEWYKSPLGQHLFEELKAILEPILATSFGYHSLQIGCTSHANLLLESCRVKHHFNLDRSNTDVDLQVHPSLLPIANDSVDLMVMMHHLSNTTEPHANLREASRVLIPEGKLIIVDFNPLSLWGVRHFFQSWLERAPWNGHYYTARRLKDWMKLLGFDQQIHYRVGYVPPIQHLSVIWRLSWLAKGLKNWVKFSGALNVLVYNKNISAMTPVRQRWVVRKMLPSRVARPSVGRGMKYDQ